MSEQMNLPVQPDDHTWFKQIAAKRKMSMKDLFHEWVDEYNNRKVKTE